MAFSGSRTPRARWRCPSTDRRRTAARHYRKRHPNEYRVMRERRAKGSRRKPPVSIESARSNRLKIDWKQFRPEGAPTSPDCMYWKTTHWKTGRFHRLDALFPDLGTGRPLPAILEDPVVGEAAASLYADAREMLESIVREKWLRARACIRLLPSRIRWQDDILLYEDESRDQV